ncbi:MAG: hypothetical protein QM534_14900 [Sediminibacterium sp.]|nr:hypothetical protein [Sediminibacterium sp.]
MFLISSASLFGQKGTRISYFNKKGMLASDEDALYYRTSTDTVNFYRSYYLNTKTRFFAGYIKSASDSTDHNNTYYDTCRWYYPNGRVQKEYVYNTQGQLNGICKDYSVDGQLNKEIEYTLNQRGNYYTEYSWAGERMMVFEENFTTNHNQWPAGTNDTGHCKLKLGGIELMNTTSRFFLKRAPVEPTGNHYSIEVSVNSNYLSDSLRAGIVFNYKDNRNYSYFFVSRLKLYAGKITDGKEQKIINMKYSNTLLPNTWNKLQIIQTGDKLIYVVNNEPVTFIIDKNPPLHATAIGTFNSGPVLFDDFCIKTFDKEIPIQNLFKKAPLEALATDEYGIISTSSGLVISENGLILSNYAPFKHVNEILIQAYDINDSLITFNATIKFKDELHDLVLLQITNLNEKKLHDIAYTYYYKPELPRTLTTKIWYLKKWGVNQFKTDSLTASLEPFRLGHFAIANPEITPSSYPTLSGTGSFNQEGEFIGLIRETQNGFKLQSIGLINSHLFYSGEKIQKNKTANTGSIYKNVVHIRTR